MYTIENCHWSPSPSSASFTHRAYWSACNISLLAALLLHLLPCAAACALQETTFKIKGDMTKVNLYYDEAAGCVRGVKPTYGEHSCFYH
jgi:hypothetical protein